MLRTYDSSSDEECDYQNVRRRCKMLLFKRPFYYVTEKRSHCGENSTVQKKIEDNTSETSGGVKVDIEDKSIPLVEPPLEALEIGHAAQCGCPNCDDVLSRFAECSICLEPLQCRGPCVCPICGGMWCDRCSRRMSRCAWCRTSLRAPAAPCVALQRLVSELMLPCRNYRRGCTDLLTASTRVSHEEQCKFDGMSCPISANCSTVMFDEISSHLQSKHNVTAVYSQKIRILIENFETKLKKTASCRTKYKIVLLHDKSAFIIKVSIYNYHVKVEIMRKKLGYSAGKVEPVKSEYCALVEFQSKKVCTKSALMIENGTYSKKAEAQWSDNILESDNDESITIHVALALAER